MSRWERFKDKAADVFWASFGGLTSALQAAWDGFLWFILLDWLDDL